MVVNFRARGISRGARKLARTPTLIKKKYGSLEFVHVLTSLVNLNWHFTKRLNIDFYVV